MLNSQGEIFGCHLMDKERGLQPASMAARLLISDLVLLSDVEAM
jgi:hypothetical protein